MSQPQPPAAELRARSESLSASLPPLLAAADHLAASVMLGAHGRRRAGMGDEFWQYRAAHPGDEARAIDWRRSGRSDAHFVREREWQAAQSVVFWLDDARSLDFASRADLPRKADRAQLLALALALLLERGGERVGLADGSLAPALGAAQIGRMAQAFLQAGEADYGLPRADALPRHGWAIFISDFLGDPAPLAAALAAAAGQGLRGVLLQILDPQEEAFPFRGRTIFESITGAIRHETQRADDLRARYLARLAERKDWLSLQARQAGWQYHCHHTDSSAAAALLWLYRALEGPR